MPGLDFIDGLRPVTYHMNTRLVSELRGDTTPEDLESAYLAKSQTIYSGFIAQEVEEHAKHIGYAFSGVQAPGNPETETYGLRYAEFVVPLVKSTQELHELIQQQQDLLHEQESLIHAQAQLLKEHEQRLRSLEAQMQPLPFSSLRSENH